MEEMAERIEQAMRLAQASQHVLLATVDETGTPRLTPVEECTPAGEGRIAIKAWVDVPPIPCRSGPSRITVLVCNADGHGYQLIGQVVRSQEAAVLDGLAEIEQQVHFPQVERFLLMQVDSVEDFHFPTTQPATRRA